MLNANGPGFAGLYAGDVVEFWHLRGAPHAKLHRAGVPGYLVFERHVQVRHGPYGYTVDAANFVRLVRRGKRHIAADKERTGFYTAEYVRAVDNDASK
jgi:hypothetical protein